MHLSQIGSRSISALLLLLSAVAAINLNSYGPPAGPAYPPRGRRPHKQGYRGPPAAASYGPQSVEYDDASGCALIIPGPGKSSHLDYGLRGFPNSVGYDGPGTCITYEAVNHAFVTAKKLIGLPAPEKRELSSKDVAQIGDVVMETTRIIAKQYNLPADAVSNGLPLIDTSKTMIDQYCPYFLKTVKCEPTRYRTYDGLCNNLENPHWGAANMPYKRLLPPVYPDGLEAPRTGYSGHPLPSCRYISASIHRDEGFHDHAVTTMLLAWGQAIDHDMTNAIESSRLDGKSIKCCERGPGHRDCYPIDIPGNDPFYSLWGRKCMSFVRSAPGLRYGCKLGPRLQFSGVSSVLDGNFIYGTSTDVIEALRTYKGGFLKTLPVFQEYGLKDLLPLKTTDPDAGCTRPQPDVYCFMAGDARVNEQLVLAVAHILLVREHNRIVYELGQINPHWDDETLYQETRHIIVAMVQHITYNEFLPMVLGKDVMQKYDLILEKEGYFGGYDAHVDPTSSAEFTTAAFRFGHSMVPNTIERWSTHHKYIGSQRLSALLKQPYDLYKGGWCDQYMSGLINQVSQANDDSMAQEITNHLFQESKADFGLDLAALNMQRGRDHGIPSYNDVREFCGLGRLNTWHEIAGVMPNTTVKRYADLYASPDDLDLWSAGLSERPLHGSMVGPTFACIIALQFRDLRFGDRFWYENGGWPSSFTVDQLQEIRKTKLSRLVCDNSDKIEEVQVYVMVLPDHDINPRVPCKSSVLPRIDLTKWRDARYQGGPHLGGLHDDGWKK